VFATCLHCHGPLGRNDVIESFPVGRRLAFDARRGRLWVVCQRCARWNLTPLDERWEAIEACERRFRDTRVRVSTDEIGLAELPEGLDLIRIGRPLRPEFAAWRYGAQLQQRRRRMHAAAGAGAGVGMAGLAVFGPAAAVAAAPMLWPGMILAGATAPLWLPPALFLVDAKDEFLRERVVARVRDPQGHLYAIRAKHLAWSTLHTSEDGEEPRLRVQHDRGAIIYAGDEALRTSGRLLASANWLGGASSLVRHAVARIEAMGDGSRFLMDTARRFTRFRHKRPLAQWRRLGALSLEPVERLALEMAVHEETERRALEGELATLAEEWREAEEIAAIADTL
jgi:hypothetical protein